MTRVTGIGGMFFRAADPQALLTWYRDILGIDLTADGVWRQEAGPTVLGLFPKDSDYWPDTDQQWMLNLRVEDLDRMIWDLKMVGTVVETRPEWDSDIGRFARIHDPEGNPIELWEPAGPAAEPPTDPAADPAG